MMINRLMTAPSGATLYTVEITDRLGAVTVLKTSGAHHIDAISNATEELFDINHPDLAHFDDEHEDGFDVERSMCVDDCRAIRVFPGHHDTIPETARPVHTE